ncbi:MAG: fumarylacetoacetate hydrolase family protein [Ketobacteraceae bacterium]|nr:fumarylacetoacetate hydrolase family protein [Ketobacteraceae bacterium]
MSTYEHRMWDNSPCVLPTGKVVCVGRNYADHARELNNPVPDSPILFIKPSTAVVPFEPGFAIPTGQGACHHETEIALLIGKTLCGAEPAAVAPAIVGLGIGLDLTLRELQSQLKEKGHPWERAKAFDGACPLTPFVPASEFGPLDRLSVSLTVNGEVRQQGNSEQMLHPIPELVAYMSSVFTLQPGDVILTGTPAGVAPLAVGDRLVATLGERFSFQTQVFAPLTSI